MAKTKVFKRPTKRHGRREVKSSIDNEAFLILDMLGFHIPSLIEELLKKVSGHKRCPCCGREVRPLITGRKIE